MANFQLRYGSEEEITEYKHNVKMTYENIAKCLPRITRALETIAKAINDESPQGNKTSEKKITEYNWKTYMRTKW